VLCCALLDGGPLVIDTSGGSSQATWYARIENNNFRNNTMRIGGALKVFFDAPADAELHVNDNKFFNNTSEEFGGGANIQLCPG
jgi:hypothetical protein